MQYLLLCCIDEKRWAEISKPQRDEIMQAYDEWAQDLVRSGHYRASGQLQPTSSATTVREKNGKRVTTDGPFAETREQLGGYHLVECSNLDEAISLAGRIPTLAFGGAIEVRPLVAMSHR